MKYIIKKSLVFLSVLVAGASLSWAQEDPVAAHMYVGTLVDVNGFDGQPLPDGSYIEFRTMYKAVVGSGTGTRTNQVAYSPESALVESRNPLKATSKVGAGVIPSARGRGLFAACVSGLEKDKQYVVRLFDGPTPEESVAYCDSGAFTYSTDRTRSATNVTFGGVWKALNGTPLDTETDSDGDGLPDSVEILRALTDPDNPDTDGDGFSDWFEYTHQYAEGMDPTNAFDANSLSIRLVSTPVPEEMLAADEESINLYDVTWDSIPDVTYHLQFVTNMLGLDRDWRGNEIVSSVTATETNTSVFVGEQHLVYPAGFFRVLMDIPTDGVPAGE